MNRLTGYSAANPGLAFAQARTMGAQNKLLRQQQEFGMQDRERALSERESQRQLSAIGMLGGIVERAAPENKQDAYAQGLNLLSEQGLDVSAFPQQFDDTVGNKLAIGRQLAFDSGLLKSTGGTAEQQNLQFKARAMVGRENPKTGRPYTEQEALADLVAIQGGVAPRAGISAQERMAMSPDLTGQVARSQSQIAAAKAGGSEAAKLAVQRQIKPEIEAAVDLAKGRTKLAINKMGEERSNQKAFEVYRTAVTGLMQDFDKATTGIGFGLIPAIGDDSRVLEASINILRPVIKDVVRSAGEGTFTDSDQKLIDQLIPTRNDSDSVAARKIERLNNFMLSKLSPSEGQQQNSLPSSDADLLKKYGIE